MYREYYRNSYRQGYQIGAVEIIIGINLFFFLPWLLFYLFKDTFLVNLLLNIFALNVNVGIFNIGNGAVWQIISAIFIHGGFWHLASNMYGLLIFGKPLELLWGAKKFTLYYLITGIFANIASVVVYLLTNTSTSLIGASGAVFAVLLAYGAYSPNSVLLLFFVIPIKMKWAILLYAVIELFAQFSIQNSGIAHMTHLFGFLFGFLYLLLFFKINAVKQMYFPDKTNYYYQ